MILRLFILASFATTFGTAGAQGQVCTGFSNGLQGNQNIKQQFTPAVVMVQDMGTAYLIDSESGYLLTAGHVLDDVTAKNEPFEVVIGDPPNSRLAFKVIERPANLDIALLQLVKSDAMKNVRALDISFEPPDYDSSLFVMGYPHYGQQAKVFLRSGAAKLSAYPPDGSIEIDHTTVGGSSGGPLIDGYGDVVAICDQEIADGKVGRYLPSTSIEDLLSHIPTSKRMTGVEAELLAGKTDINALMQLFKKTAQNPTNLELYVWLTHLKQPSFQQIDKYLRCPLVPALSERHIADAIVPFINNLSPSEQGQVKLALAEREYIMGHNDAAAQLASESAEALSPINAGLNATALPRPSPWEPLRQKALLLGRAVEEQKNLDNAQVVSQDAAPIVVTTDSGNEEKYLVQWVAVVHPVKSEEGHQAEPFQGLPTDTRTCRWVIQSEVQRKVYYVDDKGEASTQNVASRTLTNVPSSNQGSDFMISGLQPVNCIDASGRFASDVSNAKFNIENHFGDIVSADREKLMEDLAALPHVKAVAYADPDKGKNTTPQ